MSVFELGQGSHLTLPSHRHLKLSNTSPFIYSFVHDLKNLQDSKDAKNIKVSIILSLDRIEMPKM